MHSVCVRERILYIETNWTVQKIDVVSAVCLFLAQESLAVGHLRVSGLSFYSDAVLSKDQSEGELFFLINHLSFKQWSFSPRRALSTDN